MSHEEKILKTCFSKFNLEKVPAESILLRYQKEYNELIEKSICIEKKINEDAISINLKSSNNNTTTTIKPNIEILNNLKEFKIETRPMDWQSEIDINEIYRKKYSFVIYPIVLEVKNFLYSDENSNNQNDKNNNVQNKLIFSKNNGKNFAFNKENFEKKDDEKTNDDSNKDSDKKGKDKNKFKKEVNELVLFAKRAFKCSLKAYTTYRKYDPSVFNLNTIHLTRYSRAFGLYKESLKYKQDDEHYRVDPRIDINKTRSEKKFFKAQSKMMISEFV